MRRALLALLVAVAAVLAVAACGGEDADLTIYSGRNEALVGDLIEDFEKQSGLTVEVRYGDSAELAAQIAEEGDNTPADVFFSQDAGALGALAEAGRLASLPESVLDRVDPRYRADDGTWVGVSARSRVIAYDPDQVRPNKVNEVPESVLDLTHPK